MENSNMQDAVLWIALILVTVGFSVLYIFSNHEEALPILESTPIEVQEVSVPTVEEIEEVKLEEPEESKLPIISDEELIAQVVHAEANSEEMIGKVAVASVVLNRCDYFGLTVESVVYAKNQFAMADTYTKEDMRAVEIAMENRDLFPETLLYFRNKHYHTFGEPYMVIGNHYFSLAEESEE